MREKVVQYSLTIFFRSKPLNQKVIPLLFNIAKRKVLLEHFCNFWRLLYRIKGLGGKMGWNDFRIYGGHASFSGEKLAVDMLIG